MKKREFIQKNYTKFFTVLMVIGWFLIVPHNIKEVRFLFDLVFYSAWYFGFSLIIYSLFVQLLNHFGLIKVEIIANHNSNESLEMEPVFDTQMYEEYGIYNY